MAEDVVTISQRGVERFHAGHLWVYRGDVRDAKVSSGSIVRVNDERGRFLGRAFFSDRSQIAVRLLTREDIPTDRKFFLERIQAAARYRERVVADTRAFRMVYSEADLVPSLIVDRYGDYLAIQTLSQTTDNLKPLFVDILNELFSPKGIIERNDPRVRLLEGLEQHVSVLHGEVPPQIECYSNGLQWIFDLHKGQKTGSFLDQRENHSAARCFARGSALDCFAYHGGFGLSVARNCDDVEVVDLSLAAVEAARRNAEHNQVANVTFHEANSFDLLKEYDDKGRRFDLIILDPPAFAKNRESIASARRGYKEINLRALKILRPEGYLITCSCSHHIPEAMFLQIVAEAANDVHRRVVVVDRRTQAKDHPILLTMPETHYLKCIILKILE